MQKISTLVKAFCLLAVLFVSTSLQSFAAQRTFYFQATVYAVGYGGATGGSVYASFNNSVPGDEDYTGVVTTPTYSKTAGSAFSTPSSTNATLYLYAKPMAGYKFLGWATSVDATTYVSTSKEYRVNVTSRKYGNAETPEEFEYYAFFEEATEFYSSTLTGTALGNGLVSVATTTDSEEFAATQSASIKGSVEADHTYYLQAKASNAETDRFVAWYTDEACETQLSKNATYTHKVVAESTNEEAPTQFNVYAKFETIPYYYSQMTATATEGGNVFVVAANDAEADYQSTSSLIQKVADKTAHTYYLKAQKEEGYLFDGWFADAAFTELLSHALNYTYALTSESSNEAEPTSAQVYAKFSVRNTYQVINGGFENWIGNEPAPGWNSFASATGSMNGMAGASPAPKKIDGRDGTGYAVQINSTRVVIANANGNLTTGTVNMGNMTPTNASNYNYTELGRDGHFLKLDGQPDAMEFYTKYTMGTGSEHQGHVQAILHDEFNYFDPQRDEQIEHRIGQAEGFIPASEDWQLQHIDFTYDWEKEDADAVNKYLLINFTTNNTPGGSYNDVLSIDDVVLLYNSELTGASYNGEEIAFTEGAATIDTLYDATLLTGLTSNGRGASIETAYDEATGVLTITVKGEDFAFNADNKHEYTIQFNTPEPEEVYPEEGVAYYMQENDSQLFITLTDHAERNVVLSAEPERIYFTKVEGGYTISNEAGYVMGKQKRFETYLNASGYKWNIGNSDEPLVWTINVTEAGYSFTCQYGDLGFDNITAGQNGFCNKEAASNHGIFTLTVAPEPEPEPTAFEAVLTYNAEDNTVTISVNDETVEYFAFVETQDNYEFTWKDNDRAAVEESAIYTTRLMKGSQTVSANQIYKDAYYSNMRINDDYYFVLAPATQGKDYIEPVPDAPIFKLAFHYGEVIEPEAEFVFEDNGDDTFTVTPITNVLNWYACVVTEEELALINDEDKVTAALGLYCENLTSMDDTYNGAQTLNADALYTSQHAGHHITPGEYVVVVGFVSFLSNEESYIIYPNGAGAYRFDFTQHMATGVGTVLAPAAGSRTYDLQGKLLKRIQRGIRIATGKKVML